MILVIVGTDTHAFNRLLRWIDELIEERKIKDKVLAQIGHSTYIPKNYEWKKFFSYKEMLELIKKAKFVISHGGAGSIIDVLSIEKPLIVVPRRKKYNEHTDDHQVQLAKILNKKGKVLVAFEKRELEKAIEKIRKRKFKPKIKRPEKIIKLIENFLKNYEVKVRNLF